MNIDEKLLCAQDWLLLLKLELKQRGKLWIW